MNRILLLATAAALTLAPTSHAAERFQWRSPNTGTNMTATPVITNPDPSQPDETAPGPLSIVIPGSMVVRQGYSTSFDVAISNAIGDVVFELVGSLPRGLSMEPDTGKIVGEGLDLGVYQFQIKIIDSTGRTSLSNTASMVVAPAHPLMVYMGDIDANLGENVSRQPVIENALGSVVFKLNGPLPFGLHFDTATGEIRGTPTEVGTTTATIMVTDNSGQVASQIFAIKVTD